MKSLKNVTVFASSSDRVDPIYKEAGVALGRALVQLGSARSALPFFEEALAEGNAVAAEAQFEMGLAYRDLGERKRAVEVFLNGPVLYPFRPWAVRCYLEAGRDLKKDELRTYRLTNIERMRAL